MQNHVDFSFSAPYYSLNDLTEKTKHIWIVCHGYGQLAAHFIKRFDVLDPASNFIIAPQGLSRFYLMDNSGKVGASWMTREDRETDMVNQQSYLAAVIDSAIGPIDYDKYDINLLGFSQGVSMIARLVALKKIRFRNLVFWAGGFPPELKRENFDHIKEDSKLYAILGRQDQYYEESVYNQQIKLMQNTIGVVPEVVLFDGKHEIKREVLKNLFSDH